MNKNKTRLHYNIWKNYCRTIKVVIMPVVEWSLCYSKVGLRMLELHNKNSTLNKIATGDETGFTIMN